MYIIPAIDIIDGKCVRLTQGEYSTKKIYNESPEKVAKEFQNLGFKKLHLVDLDGAKSGRIVNHKVLEKIANSTNLEIDFGGGIQTKEDVKIAFENGANQINLGSKAVKEPEKVIEFLKDFGIEKIIVGADVKLNKENLKQDFLKNYELKISGWKENTGENLKDFLNYYSNYNLEFLTCTDIEKDGTLDKPNFELYEHLIQTFFEIKIIASGGVSAIEDLKKLKEIGVYGAIVGKAIYEKHIDIEELAKYQEEVLN
jgi:phosphoribosylformimino-5-aminoimidazole carboxamide ribotide isomerase